MNIQHIQNLLIRGEGISIEFKECRTNINRTTYQSICAFLNRIGGELLLGVKDNGEITGIDPDKIGQIKKDFVTAMNNDTKIFLTYYLVPEEFVIDNKHILYIHVPESSEVHRCNNCFFDRNNDSDIDITNIANQ